MVEEMLFLGTVRAPAPIYHRNALKNFTEFTNDNNITTSQTWDDNSRLVSRTDDNGNTTRTLYDERERPVFVMKGGRVFRRSPPGTGPLPPR